MLVEGVELREDRMPVHIGIIMDGNGRWAKKRGLPRTEGHRKGFGIIKSILKFNREKLHIPFLTVYAFSRENWNRPKKEVDMLMKLGYSLFKDNLKYFIERGIRVVHSGEIDDRVPDFLVKAIKEAQEKTKDGKTFTFNVAFNYGGRYEIVKAAIKLAEDIKSNPAIAGKIDENVFRNYLYHPDIPDPDLIIRTSGELRLSNFLLWGSAYAEFYFTPTYWPDFTPAELVKAIADYQKRERRFGGVKENDS